ncbi:MAG: hypothetical protein ABF242_02320 [Flavobacteriales bacterium]
MKKVILISFSSLLLLINCKKDRDRSPATETEPQLQLDLTFDTQLPRLGNFGQPVGVAPGNAAQNPTINEASLHYIEFAADSLTPLTTGSIVYQGSETSMGGSRAIDFGNAQVKSNNTRFVSVDLSKLTPGTYNWLRVSLSYQNYDVEMIYNNPPLFVNAPFTGTVASFVGYNNYISSLKVKDSTILINGNKLQGFWALESQISVGGNSYGSLTTGDSSNVTVVNPISSTSPVPDGSCVVTGKLASPLVITGNETESISVVLAFSINNSFEWKEINTDGKFEPAIGETVVDMGLRGLHPYVR